MFFSSQHPSFTLVAHHCLCEVLHTGRLCSCPRAGRPFSWHTRRCLLLSMWDVETAEQVTALIPPEATAREPGVGPTPGGCVSHMREPNCSGGFAFNVPSGSLQPETPRVFWPDGQRKWTCGHGDVHHAGSAIRRVRLWKRSQRTPAQCINLWGIQGPRV